MSGHRWAAAIEHGADKVLERCVDLDPPNDTATTPMVARCGSSQRRRGSPRRRCSSRRSGFSPGRSMLKPIRVTVEDRRARRPRCVAGRRRSLGGRRGPSRVGGRSGRCQQDEDARRRRRDLHAQRRAVFGVAPTAKAARVLERDTGMRADTVAKLLHEWQRPDRPPRPSTGSAPGDARRRRGRDAVHPGPASARQPRRGEPVAPRAGR